MSTPKKYALLIKECLFWDDSETDMPVCVSDRPQLKYLLEAMLLED
jgi:hypothetical protein